MKRIMVFMLCLALVLANLSMVPVLAEDGEGADENTEMITQEGAPEEGTTEAAPGDEDPPSDPEDEDPPVVSEEGTTEEKEDGSGEDEPTEEPTEESTEETQGEPAEIRKLSISRETSTISFGTVQQGESVSPESFSVINEGNVPVDLDWVQSDPDNAFLLEILSDNEKGLEPGEGLDCQVSLQESVGPGDYSATIVFSDVMVSEDPLIIEVSAKVEEKKEEPTQKKEETTEGPTEKKEETTGGPTEKKEETTEKKKGGTNKTTCTVKTVCSPKEGGSAVGGGTFKKGGKTTLTVFENDGYQFEGWYLDGKKVSDKHNLAVTNLKSDKTFTAKFKRGYYKISVKSENKKYGEVSGGGSYKAGEDIQISAEPKKGYVFKGWYEDDRLISKDSDYIVEDIDENHWFTAVFGLEKPAVKIRVYPKNAGVVTGAGRYEKNSDVRMTADANDGYEFRGFVLNNKVISTKDDYTLRNVDRDLSVTALFRETDAESVEIISGISNEGGVISPSGKMTMPKHSTITYSITPQNGYAVLEVEVDGRRVGAVSSWTFSDITEDHTIAAAFAPKEGNVNNVQMSNIITEEEADKLAVADLFPAEGDEESRFSNVITPEMYAVMQEEGTLDDALKIPTQSAVGMKSAGDLGSEVGGYNYDTAEALYQRLDITPEEAKEMIDSGDDSAIFVAAYETGILNVLVNNQYLAPGKESETNDVFEKNGTVQNMLEFVSGMFTKEEKIKMLEGNKAAVNLAVTSGEDMDEEDKDRIEKSGAKIDEYFFMTVMKKIGDHEPEIITKLARPVEVTLAVPKGTKANCAVRLHEGKTEILEDLDDVPETLTIKTDRFSPYAFAETDGGSTGSQGMSGFLIGGGVIILAAIAGAIVFLKKRRENP